MSEAPERIWVQRDTAGHIEELREMAVKPVSDVSEAFQEYIRADLHQQALRDRIAELEAELNLIKTSGIIEVATRNPNVMEYMRHWEDRAEAAEAKLANGDGETRRAWFTYVSGGNRPRKEKSDG